MHTSTSSKIKALTYIITLALGISTLAKAESEVDQVTMPADQVVPMPADQVTMHKELEHTTTELPMSGIITVSPEGLFIKTPTELLRLIPVDAEQQAQLIALDGISIEAHGKVQREIVLTEFTEQ